MSTQSFSLPLLARILTLALLTGCALFGGGVPPLQRVLLLFGSLILCALVLSKERVSFDLGDGLILALWIWCAIGVSIAPSYHLSLQTFVTWTTYFSTYLLVRRLWKKDDHLLVTGLACMACVVAILPILQRFGLKHALPVGFGNPNHMAAFLAPGIWLCAAQWRHTHNLGKRWGWAVATALCFLGMIATTSRGSLLGLLGGLLCFFLMNMSPKWRPSAALACGSLITAGLYYFLQVRPPLIWDAILPRLEIWGGTWDMIRTYPLGVGTGAFTSMFPPFQPLHFSSHVVNHVHNDYLEFWAEAGTPGILLLLVIIAFLLRRCWLFQHPAPTPLPTAYYLGGLVSILIHGFFEFNAYIPATGLMITCFIALSPFKHSKAEPPRGNLPPLAVWATAMVLMLGLIRVPLSDTALALAKKAHQIEDQAGAINFLNQAERLHRHNSLIWETRGLWAKSSEEALAAYEKALAIFPHRAHLHAQSAVLYERLECIDSAEKSYKAAIQYSPTRAEYHLNLARFLWNQQQEPEARDFIQSYLDLNPEGLVNLKTFKKLWATPRDLQDLIPDDARSWTQLADSLAQRNRWPAAIEARQYAYNLDPSELTAQKHLTDLLETKDTVTTLKQANAYVATYPDGDHLLFLQARSLHAVGRCTEAQVQLERLSQTMVRPEAAFLFLALCQEPDNPKKALETLRRAARYLPNHARVHFSLGQLYGRLKLKQLALTHLKRAVRLEPNSIAFQLALADIAFKWGHRSTALIAYEYCAEAMPQNEHVIARLKMLEGT